MLELRDIHKTFNIGTINEKKALDGVNLVLEEGDKKKDIEEKLSTEFYVYGKEEIKRMSKKNHHNSKKDDDLGNLDHETLKEIKELMKD